MVNSNSDNHTGYKAIIVLAIFVIYNCIVNKASNITYFEPLPQAGGGGGSCVALNLISNKTLFYM